MATAVFTVRGSSEPVMFIEPSLNARQLEAKIDRSMEGPNPNLALMPQSGPVIAMRKADILSISYRD